MRAPAASDTPSYSIRAYRMPAKVFHWITAGLIFGMVGSGVIAKQLGGGPVADTLFSLHKAAGSFTLVFVLLRICYRLVQTIPPAKEPHRRPFLHWTLYGVVVLVPLLGWAGISDFGAREIFPGYSLPAIWPEGAGYDEILLQYHAYLAVGGDEAKRAFDAMMHMRKIDVAAIEKARRG